MTPARPRSRHGAPTLEPALRRARCLAAAGFWLAAAGLAAPQGEGRGPWTALATPALASSPAPTATLTRLERGRALSGPRGREPRSVARGGPAELPPGALLGLLQDEIAARGLRVELHPTASPLLARGAPQDLEVLRGVLAELDRLGRALEVTLSVWIEPVADAAAPAEDAAAFERVAAREPDFRAVVRSGQPISFGERTVAAFLTGYDIEVAPDSGVADPEPSQALLGQVLHVRASRVRGGTAVHLACLSETTALAGEVGRFDPDTPDLGLLEQPLIRAAQVAFADVVPSGGATRVSVRGTEDGWADGTLWIRAETRPDPEGGSWGGLDLALFESRSLDLPMPQPGTGLEWAVSTWGDAPGGGATGPGEPESVLREAFPAAQVAAAAETGSARQRPGVVWTPGYLLAPRSGSALGEARTLVAALEAERLETLRLAVDHGTLRVDLPAVEGDPLRVLFGTETVRLVDYDTHVAQESWMPVPVVEGVLDGLCLQAHLASGALRGLAWVARTTGARELERDEVGVGRLQLVERGLQSRPVLLDCPRLDAAGDVRLFSLRSTAPGLTLELRARD